MLFAEPKKQNIYSKGTGRRMRGETTAGGQRYYFVHLGLCVQDCLVGEMRVRGGGVMGCKDSLRRPVITSKHRGDIVGESKARNPPGIQRECWECGSLVRTYSLP